MRAQKLQMCVRRSGVESMFLRIELKHELSAQKQSF